LRHPAKARRALERARQLRELLFSLFSAAARGKTLPEAPLARFNDALASALGHLQVALEGRKARWRWSGGEDLERVLWPVARSAAELLTSDGLGRVRECSGRGCAWLFLDRSRNGTRRWCDMSVCGNREKVRRFKERRQRTG
jgi:predicted RNA-binding Zn ribbon-like protein